MSWFEHGKDPVTEIYTWTHNLCKRIARQGWNTQRYNNGQPWDEDSTLELCHETIELLMADSNARLNAILDSAESEIDIRKGLAYEVRNTLHRREQNQPFNNLIRRIRRLARDGHFTITKVKRVTEYLHKPGSDPDYRQLTNSELQACARRCEDIPVVYSTRNSSVSFTSEGKEQRQQTSPMYQTEDLIEVVNRILETPGTVTTDELRKIFDILLTPWSRNLDVPFEEDQQSSQTLYDTDENELDDSNHQRDNAMPLLLTNLELEFPSTIHTVNEFVEEEVFLLLCVGSNVSYVEIGGHLGITRQTASTRTERARRRLESALLADDQFDLNAAALVRTLLIQRLGTLFAADLTVEECKIWIGVAQESHRALTQLADTEELDIRSILEDLKTRFNNRVLFALRQDDREQSTYDQIEALRETQNACAERVPE